MQHPEELHSQDLMGKMNWLKFKVALDSDQQLVKFLKAAILNLSNHLIVCMVHF